MVSDDDLQALAKEAVLYLTRTITMTDVGSTTEVYRGRLHQALSGNWVFNTSVGANGILGFVLPALEQWNLSQSPSAGTTVNTAWAGGAVKESFLLGTLIPADFQD